METTFIYGLIDPQTCRLRYIGKSDNPQSRLAQHISDTRHRRNTHCSTWIRSLLAKEIRPTIEVIDEVLISEWPAIEAAYIQFYREEGFDLVNHTQGGEGALSGKDNPWYGKGPMLGKKHSAASIARMGMKGEKHPNFGKQMPEKTRLKISAAHVGKIASKESIAKRMAKIGQNYPMLGKKHSMESRAKMSAALSGENHPQFGKPKSPETRLKIGMAQIGKVISQEHRAKLRAFQLGKPGYWTGKKMPQEVRDKIKAGFAKARERNWVNECVAVMWN